MVKIFIDESGDLGKNGSKYFILTALIVEDEKQINKIIKNIQRNKFKKKLKKARELKANKSSKELRVYLLKKINTIKKAKIIHLILNKKKTFSNFLKNDKNKYYNYVAGKLANNINLNCEFEIIIDKSKNKSFLRKDFDNYFKTKLLSGTIKSISHSYSHNYKGLQIVDFIAWSCFQKFEYSNTSFIDLLNVDQEFIEMYKKHSA